MEILGAYMYPVGHTLSGESIFSSVIPSQASRAAIRYERKRKIAKKSIERIGSLTFPFLFLCSLCLVCIDERVGGVTSYFTHAMAAQYGYGDVVFIHFCYPSTTHPCTLSSCCRYYPLHLSYSIILLFFCFVC